MTTIPQQKKNSNCLESVGCSHLFNYSNCGHFMDDLKKYVELCEAQQRSIDNYARVINALKDDFYKLQGAVLAEREAIIDIVAQHGGSVEIEAAIRARGNA